jgi:transcriptional regulator with XRE-family HTH domain
VSLLNGPKLIALRAVPVSPEMPNRVKVAAALANVDQQAIVDATGLAQPYVSDVYRGRYERITVDNARKFADYFGCAIEDLFPARDSARVKAS